MPHVNPDDQTPNTLPSTVEKALPTVVVGTVPTIICGVGRKVNIGNFETVDVYAGVTIPTSFFGDVTDLESLGEILEASIQYGFSAVSQEANNRYNIIKNNQKR